MQGRVVVVTGASSGIGAHLAQQLGGKGAKVVLAARREDELKKVAVQCGPEALAVATDVTRRSEVQRLADEALRRFGQIDAWVNNAGRGISRMPSQLTDEDLDDMMLVNVKSALYGMQAVLPHFQARNAGHVVNVSSVLGRLPMAVQRSAYSASKHFLNALTANLRMELRQTHPGITVTLFSPGVVATDFGLNAKHGGLDNRQLPGAQPVEEVAAGIVEVLEHPRADVYSRPQYKQGVAAYYAADDMAEFEQRAALGPPRR